MFETKDELEYVIKKPAKITINKKFGVFAHDKNHSLFI